MNTDCQHVIFSSKAYNAIINETFTKDPLETGGILLGHILDNGIWVVMEVLPPGQRSIFEHAYFEYDEAFVNYLAQSVATEYKHELSLLGLWHRHPGSMNTFSNMDNGTNRTFAGLNPKGAISGLVNVDPNFRFTMYHISNLFRYQKVEIEVGDDLIPEEYFKLKHFPAKGLNPAPPAEKKNNTEKKYANGSANQDCLKGLIMRCLDTKYFFLLIFIVGLTLSSFSFYSYKKLKGPDDIKSLYRLFYSEYPSECVPATDSIDKLTVFKDTLFAKDSVHIDPLVRDSLIKEFLEQGIITDVITENEKSEISVDTLPLAHQAPLVGSEPDSLKKDSVNQAGKKHIFRNIGSFKNLGTKDRIKAIVIFLAIIAFLSLIVAFIPRRNKWIVDWLVIGASLIVSIFITEWLSSGYYSGILNPSSPAYFIAIALLFSVLCFITFILLFLSDSFSFYFTKDTRFWFQKHPQLYMAEEKQIKERFPCAEKNVENGILSFYIPNYKCTDNQSGTLSFQLVYPSNYDKSREIKVYLISPDLDNLLGGSLKDFPYIAVDSAGESYLALSKTIRKEQVSGIEVVRKLNEWMQKYQSWKTNSIDIKNIKL
jgi:hypothetical protein